MDVTRERISRILELREYSCQSKLVSALSMLLKQLQLPTSPTTSNGKASWTSQTTQPAVYGGCLQCFHYPLTLTWTTGPLTCVGNLFQNGYSRVRGTLTRNMKAKLSHGNMKERVTEKCLLNGCLLVRDRFNMEKKRKRKMF